MHKAKFRVLNSQMCCSSRASEMSQRAKAPSVQPESLSSSPRIHTVEGQSWHPHTCTPTHVHTHTHAHPHMYTPTRELNSHMWLKTAIPIVLSSGELFWCDSLLPLTNKTPKDKDWTEYHWCVPNIWHSRISVCQFIDHVWLKGKFGGLIFYFVVFVMWFLLAQGGQRNVLSILLKKARHWELL